METNQILNLEKMHRLERNILHHAKQRKEQRKYLKYTSTENGCCFKDNQAFENKKGICYIPELSDTKYSYKDFIKIAKGDEDLAHTLFSMVDWQSPETLLEDFNN